MTPADYIHHIASLAKQSFYQLNQSNSEQKNQALHYIAKQLLQQESQILAANQQDLENARKKGLEHAMLDRLTLTPQTLHHMSEGLKQIAALPDPIGEMDEFRIQANGLKIGKMRVPLGVIGMIYEARPNVTIDAAALCLKSGNACILRGGSEAIHSNLMLAQIIQQSLIATGLPQYAVCFIEHTDRENVGAMLQCQEYIDVIIPRGGKSLVSRISQEARIPVIKHLDGICHVYIDEFANKEKAIAIAYNAKTSRYGTCNTMETLLIHHHQAQAILPILNTKYLDAGVILRGCEHTRAILPHIEMATEQDWHTEYLAPILSIKIVFSLEEAITHINHYGSHHTDSIITEHYTHANHFLRLIDSASVMVNASTRFADGFEYGLGAEIGISTDKIHVRGPVGLHGLTSQKWIVLGDGQIRN